MDFFADNYSKAAEIQVIRPEFDDKKIAADGFKFLADKFLNRQAEFLGKHYIKRLFSFFLSAVFFARFFCRPVCATVSEIHASASFFYFSAGMLRTY